MRKEKKLPTKKVYIRDLAKGTCPDCKRAGTKGQVRGLGEYINGKWNTINHFCDNCVFDKVEGVCSAGLWKLRARYSGIEFVGYQGTHIDETLRSIESRLNMCFVGTTGGIL